MEWLNGVPPDATVELDGQKVALREVPFVKESPDLPHFINKALAAHREVGARIPVRKADTPEVAAEWRKTHLPRLYDAGLLAKPPAKPEEYEIKQPEGLHPGLNWDEARAQKFAQVGVKHGIPKEAMAEFLALHREAVLGTVKALETSEAAAMEALKAEFGSAFEGRQEMAKQLMPLIFKTPEELAFFEETGISNHPQFLSVMMRLAPFAQQDQGMWNQTTQGGGKMTREEVQSKVADVMSNPQNPLYAGYQRGDSAVMKQIDDWYKQLPDAAKQIVIGASAPTGGM